VWWAGGIGAKSPASRGTRHATTPPKRRSATRPERQSALVGRLMARDNVAKARRHPPDTIPLLDVCRLPPSWRFCRYQQVGAGSEPVLDAVAELVAAGEVKHALMAPGIWGETGRIAAAVA